MPLLYYIAIVVYLAIISTTIGYYKESKIRILSY